MFKKVVIALATVAAGVDARSTPGDVLRLHSEDSTTRLDSRFLAASFANTTDFEPLFQVLAHSGDGGISGACTRFLVPAHSLLLLALV